MRSFFLIALMALFGVAANAADTERWTIGLTPNDQPIEAIVIPGASAASPTVLLLGGMQGPDSSVDAVRGAAAAFEAIAQRRRPYRLIAVPLANAEAQALQFPPTGIAYQENAQSHVLWRWIGIHAPDRVLIAAQTDSGLADALSNNAVALVGSIPAQRVVPGAGMLQAIVGRIAKSPAHQQIDRRLSRSPQTLAKELAGVYGHNFDQVTYINAVALLGRLHLGQIAEVSALSEPYLNGSKDSFARPSQSALAAHLFFYDLARRQHDERADNLVIRAANNGFTDSGELREFMPLNGGWSDSVFMDIPVLVRAGGLTGERKYFDMAARHLRYMQNIVLRPDGLYRHQASSDAAWGRGNGFPALGMALTLTGFPADHPDYGWMLASYQAHMKTLAGFQDENGMWREVIDAPGAYPEYSGTAMIATAMLIGIRSGWLDGKTYRPLIDKAWRAVLARTASDGSVLDVAESTGTRGLTYKDYLRRAAIMGRDDRAGGFALYLATQMAGL